jgi:reactive intermediate/imine deaminase
MKESIKQCIETDAAPQPQGTYSQAVRAGNTVYISGQLPISLESQQIIINDFKAEALQVFHHLRAIARAAGGDLDQIVKLTIFLTDLSHFSIVNETMKELFTKPYPARSTFQVSALPAGARIEIEAVMMT